VRQVHISSHKAEIRGAGVARLLVWPVIIIVLLVTFYGRAGITAAMGNIMLITCQKHFDDSSPEPQICAPLSGSSAQRDRLRLGQTQLLWRAAEYDQLTATCGNTLCACVSAPGTEQAILVRQLRTYYAVLAYENQTGQFPALDTCVDSLPNSAYVWGKSLASERANQLVHAAVNQELAYLLDRGWNTDWDRGLAAFKQGEAYRRDGSLAQAYEAYLRAVESFRQEDKGPNTSYLLAWSLGAAADIAVAQGQPVAAVEFYKQSILTSPKDASGSFTGLVKVRQLQRHDVEQIAEELEALQRATDAPDPFLVSGAAQALFAINAYDAALSLITRAPESIRDAPSLIGIRGQIAQISGDLDQAVRDYRVALERTQENEPLQAASWAAKLGDVEAARGNMLEAVRHLELAVQLNPRAGSYWYTLAVLYEQQDELEKARSALHRALERNPKNSEFQKALAKLESATR
jgi:tetratricopeptide (TPR) repeat protein